MLNCSFFNYNWPKSQLSNPSKSPLLFLQQASQEKDFRWTTQRQQMIINALSSSYYVKAIPHIRQICAKLAPTQLHLLIKEIARQVIQKQQSVNYLTHFTDLLSTDRMEAAIRSADPLFEGALNTAKEMAVYAKYYLEINQSKDLKPNMNSALDALIRTVEMICETLVTTFGLKSFINSTAESQGEAQSRYYTFMYLTSILSTCATIAAGITGSFALGALAVGATVAAATALMAIYVKYLKPAPHAINGFSNLTAEALSNKIDSVSGRENYIDQIAETLIVSASKPKAHPLLVGPSGVGKTEIMRGFAHAVAEGRYPELKGKQVFYINVADLLNNFIPLRVIQNKIKYRKEDVILILDEIHEATSKKGSFIGACLKTLLDDGEDNFPYVIAATTPKEYVENMLEGNIDDDGENAFARRFNAIAIESMNKDQTVAILSCAILKHSYLQALPETLEKLYDLCQENFPKRPQPLMACRILNKAIKRLKTNMTEGLDRRIAELQAKHAKCLSNFFLHRDLYIQSERRRALVAERIQIEKSLRTLQSERDVKDSLSKQIAFFIQQFGINKRRLCQLSLQMSKTIPSERQIKEFALRMIYLSEAWESAIQELKQKNGVQENTLNEAFIKEVVREECERREKVKDTLNK